jgi:hypothetical protein
MIRAVAMLDTAVTHASRKHTSMGPSFVETQEGYGELFIAITVSTQAIIAIIDSYIITTVYK